MEYHARLGDVKNLPRLAHPQFSALPGPAGSAIPSDSEAVVPPWNAADFNRGFSGVLRSRLSLRKQIPCSLKNSFPPGFLIHRPPHRAIQVRIAGGGQASRGNSAEDEFHLTVLGLLGHLEPLFYFFRGQLVGDHFVGGDLAGLDQLDDLEPGVVHLPPRDS